MKNIPLQITFPSGSLFGILRYPYDATKLIILCPASTGTRIGPQRIFVEIAQALEETSIASFCVDLPPLGDSYDNQIQKNEDSYSQRLSQHYVKFLKLMVSYFQENYSYREIYLLSISDGCSPIYNFSKHEKKTDGLILLSPIQKLDTDMSINRKNVKHYLYKILEKDSWYKLFTLNLNFRNILKNIYGQPIKSNPEPNNSAITSFSIPGLLTLFGEKEPDLDKLTDFWKLEKEKGKIKEHTSGIITDADHSFFGWQFKREVIEYIIIWLKEKEN